MSHPEWHTPHTWLPGAVLPWHLRTALRDNVRILRRDQIASAKVSIPVGHDAQVRTESEQTVAWNLAEWNFGRVAGEGLTARTNKLTVPLNGLYEVWYVIEWNADGAASGVRFVGLKLNGADADMPLWTCEPGGETGDRTDQTGYYLLLLTEGDQLELTVQHTSSVSEVNINSGREHSRFGLRFIGTTDEGATGAYTWTAPRSWTAGDFTTTTAFNTDIRDNLLNLRNCRGVAAIARLSVDESITVGTATAIPWDETALNMGSVWSIASPTRFTAPVTGWYQAAAFFRWDFGFSGQRRHDLRVNGTTTYRVHTSSRISDGARGTAVSAYVELALNATDYVEWVVFSNQTVATATIHMSPSYGSLMLLGD